MATDVRLARLSRRVDAHDENFRVLSDAVLDVKETLERHGELLERHGEVLERHSGMLEEILRRLKPAGG